MTKKKLNAFVEMCTHDDYHTLEQLQYYFEGLVYKYMVYQGDPIFGVKSSIVKVEELEKGMFNSTKYYDEYVEQAIESGRVWGINLEFAMDSSG